MTNVFVFNINEIGESCIGHWKYQSDKIRGQTKREVVTLDVCGSRANTSSIFFLINYRVVYI